MDFEFNVFEYTENCYEYITLLEATRENATRKQLNEGQILLKKIFKSYVIIASKVGRIKNEINNFNCEVTCTDLEEFVTKLDNNHNSSLEIKNHLIFNIKLAETYNTALESVMQEIRYIDAIEEDYQNCRFNKIRKFLDLGFNHNLFFKNVKKSEEKERKSPYGISYKTSIDIDPIQKTIKDMLKSYSETTKDYDYFLKRR